MKKSLVVVLAGLSLLFAGYAEAAKPKKRSRSANRIGAYGGALFRQTTYSANGAEAIAELSGKSSLGVDSDHQRRPLPRIASVEQRHVAALHVEAGKALRQNVGELLNVVDGDE